MSVSFLFRAAAAAYQGFCSLMIKRALGLFNPVSKSFESLQVGNDCIATS